MIDFDLLMDVATNPHWNWKEPKPKRKNNMGFITLHNKDGSKKLIHTSQLGELKVVDKRIKKFDPKRKVWIVKPFEHGNGGWYGFKVLSSKKGMQLKRALSIKNPEVKYDCYNTSFYEDSKHGALRICFRPDPNRTLYYFHSGDRRWYKL